MTHRAAAQSFELLRYDEEYASAHPDTTVYARLKFISLSANQRLYASVGGEIRLNYAVFDREDWRADGLGRNSFLLQRYVLHTDLHLGKRVRFFVQLRSALENGRKNGPRPIDEDQVNVQNLFADLKLLVREKSGFSLRLGRQELNYGSGRLISVRELPNVRLYFTGAKALFRHRNTGIDGFVMWADTINPGVFDNRTGRRANLWGLYSTTAFGKNRLLEGYYMGYRQDQIAYEAGLADESRHTLGTRLAKSGDGFFYNLEAAYQFGRFGNGAIRAWTVSIELGYQFNIRTHKPLVGLRNDYISGDNQPGNDRLTTFNPLYPKGGYFGFDAQIGPANLIDVHPYGTLPLSRALQWQWDVVFNWRFSTRDGIYRASGEYQLSGSRSSERYIGTAYLGKFLWEITPLLNADFGLHYFQTGPFIRRTIPTTANAIFTNTRLTFKF